MQSTSDGAFRDALLVELKVPSIKAAIELIIKLAGDKALQEPELGNSALLHSNPYIYHVDVNVLCILSSGLALFLIDLKDRSKLVLLAECIPDSDLVSAVLRVDAMICILHRQQDPLWFESPSRLTLLSALAQRFARRLPSLPSNPVILDVAKAASAEDLVQFRKDYLQERLDLRRAVTESKKPGDARPDNTRDLVVTKQQSDLLSKLVGNFMNARLSSGQSSSSKESKLDSKGELAPLLDLQLGDLVIAKKNAESASHTGGLSVTASSMASSTASTSAAIK